MLERVVKLELPPEDNDVTTDDSFTSLASSSVKPSQPNPSQTNPASVRGASAAVPLAETDDVYENIYESLD